MGTFIDMTGKRYGRLTAIKKTDMRASNGDVMWLFKCDCGNEIIIKGASVRSGLTRSCGCYHFECARKIGSSKKIHGKNPQRLYNIWCGMKARCGNENSPKFQSYGARGIRVCDEWVHNFPAFRDWALSNGYAENLSIDRIDVNGNYEPNNCRWATAIEQSRNRRSNHIVEYNGENICLMEYAQITGQNYNTAKNRIRKCAEPI